MISRSSKTFAKLGLAPVYDFRYTRKFFEDANIDYEAIERAEKQKQQLDHKQKIKEIPSNDKNPGNFIKNIKINSPAIDQFKRFDAGQVVNSCAILTPEPKQPRVFVTAIRKYIITSIKKAVDAMYPVKKKYLYDAIHHLEQSHKKVAKLMIRTFYNLAVHAVDQGRDPTRLFVHGVIIGKTKRYKGIRYHAKARHGVEKKDFCQIKVILYQKDSKQFFQQIGSGHAPPAFASIIRNRLIQLDANHEKLVEFTGITTSKGRQQKRQILKRRADARFLQIQEKGDYVPKKTIMKQIVEQEGEKAKQMIYGLQKPGALPSVQRREQLYRKNMGVE